MLKRIRKLIRLIETLSGIVLMILSVAVGLYVGLWWAFIGGIAQIINALVTTPIDGYAVAYGLARFWFAGPLGVAVGVGVFILGLFLLRD